jgi:hypothetical protein
MLDPNEGERNAKKDYDMFEGGDEAPKSRNQRKLDKYGDRVDGFSVTKCGIENDLGFNRKRSC